MSAGGKARPFPYPFPQGRGFETGGDVGNSETNVNGGANAPDIGTEGSRDFGGGITLKSAAVSMMMVLALGMLIWVKLRLVTNVPRTAYADPERRAIEPKPGAANPQIAKQETADASEKH